MSITPAAPAAPTAVGSGPDRPRVLFIGGLGRSGTTVVERVLGEVPGVCSAGELVHLWHRAVLSDERCGCGRPFSRCPFWQAVGTRAFGGWDRALAERMETLRARVDRTRFIPRLALRGGRGRAGKDLDEYVGVYRRLYRAIAEESGAAVVIDSSKHSSLAFCLRTDPGIDLRVVHAVRDSRGVAYSWTKEVRRPESAAGTDLMTRYSPVRSALLWLGHNASLALLGRLGTPTRLLRYEDFVADPARSVRELAVFAGRPGPQPLDFLDAHAVTLGASHTVAGNPMRFTVGEVTLRRDDAWRTALPRGQRRLTTLLTLPLLAAYGYLHRSAR
ncbi:Sulfotransferase family protein [Modestobacter sp. DSM 44400]|uniref:sulfotransferase n=1 Tax=Modestobacter sp. DSM 44400 TaxID=1550230 RepID=UPI000896F0FD|nr:sulfotransferase [Modestobacter sp. DSM 44400]SDX86444.1 Sulfotransferase family protein [Modestobacter sp. DSM 44400]